MDEEYRTAYADDAIRVENGTQPEEIHSFIERRASNPIQIDGKIVWNFNNHVVDEEQLAGQIEDFIYDEYVIPYQASGAWGYMVTLLPQRIREAEILTFNQHHGQYNPYPNYIRHSDNDENEAVRMAIERWIAEKL